MDEKKEFKQLYSFAKKVVDKKVLLKLKNVESLSEKIHLLQYSLKVHLEKRVADFRKEIKKIKGDEKEEFFLGVQTNLLNVKIKYFCVDFNKKEFSVILRIIKKIEKEMKNV